MTPIATLHMWSDVADCRSCQVFVYGDDRSVLEMRAHGQTVARQEFDSLDLAMTTAADWRSPADDTRWKYVWGGPVSSARGAELRQAC
jgi:hypothetical protein